MVYHINESHVWQQISSENSILNMAPTNRIHYDIFNISDDIVANPENPLGEGGGGGVNDIWSKVTNGF